MPKIYSGESRNRGLLVIQPLQHLEEYYYMVRQLCDALDTIPVSIQLDKVSRMRR